jgi:hypothetical protein
MGLCVVLCGWVEQHRSQHPAGPALIAQTLFGCCSDQRLPELVRCLSAASAVSGGLMAPGEPNSIAAEAQQQQAAEYYTARRLVVVTF